MLAVRWLLHNFCAIFSTRKGILLAVLHFDPQRQVKIDPLGWLMIIPRRYRELHVADGAVCDGSGRPTCYRAWSTIRWDRVKRAERVTPGIRCETGSDALSPLHSVPANG